MTNVLISAAGQCGATIIGAILGFFVKELPHKWNDAVLGYCAGIMLAASTLGLIVPAFEQTGLWWLVVVGVMAGALFLNVLDLVTPHLHHITGLDPEEHRNNARLSHVMLFVMAIALHKLPEGMAAGVSVCSSEGATEWGVSFGIALQNIPEGAAVSLPLAQEGRSKCRAFAAGAASGLVEPLGGLMALALAGWVSAALPWLMSLAAGCMVCVTAQEMIPEAVEADEPAGVISVVAGFALMMALDVAL